MSFLTFVADRGTTQEHTASATTAVTTTAEIAANRIVVVRFSTAAYTNGNTPPFLTPGASNYHTGLTDDAGTSYMKIGESTVISNESVPYNSHCDTVVSLWIAKLGTALPSGTVLTLATTGGDGGDASNYNLRAASVSEFKLDDAEEPTATIEVAGVATANDPDVGSPAHPVALTCTPAAGADDYTWLLAVGHNYRSGYTHDVGANYTEDRGLLDAYSGGGFNGLSGMWGQYRGVNTDSEVYDASCYYEYGWAAVLGAILVVPAAPPPSADGTREFQADFETPTHHDDRTSTSRRVDAIVPDYRRATSVGPAAIGDTTGPQSYVWRVRAVPGAVYLCRENLARNDWQDEELLFTVGSPEIDEIDLCFDALGYPVVVYQANTQVGGGPTVALYGWSVAGGDYTTTIFGAGRTARCVNDYFPNIVGPNVCPPDVDVQVFWLKDGAGMKRRSSADGYGTDNATVLTSASALLGLQQAFRTEDRRVSVLYSQRTVLTGRYQFRRVDSKRYKDSKLRRPLVIDTNGLGTDINSDYMEAFWRNGSTVTADFYLRAQCQEECSGFEFAASATYPGGDDSTFTEQEQTTAGGNAGDYQDGVFSITYGEGAMSLVAFRVRVWKTVGEITCYSPWRYVIIPDAYPQGGTDGTFLTTCERDMILDAPSANVWARDGLVEVLWNTHLTARYDTRPGECVYGPFYSEADTAGAGGYSGWCFIGGERNYGGGYPFPTHLQAFAWRRRAWEPFDFSDENGRYAGRIIGAVTAGGSGSPTNRDYNWPGSRFPKQFPEDDGSMLPEPNTADIWVTT